MHGERQSATNPHPRVGSLILFRRENVIKQDRRQEFAILRRNTPKYVNAIKNNHIPWNYIYI